MLRRSILVQGYHFSKSYDFCLQSLKEGRDSVAGTERYNKGDLVI